MAREYWYFVAGILAVMLPLLLLVAVKKLHWLEVRPDQTITYKMVDDHALSLHAFMAKNRQVDTAPPAILFFHGGGWLYGGPRAFYPQCQYFVDQGITCFTASYRLGAHNRPDVRGAVEDARDALEYLIEHARELHIDPGNIIVGGGSSGGHLAATLGVAMTGNQPAPNDFPRPAALVLYNPVLDLAPGTPEHHLVRDYWQDVSPYQHIDNAVPPSLILVGSEDAEVPVATVAAFCDEVRSLGGHCELAVYKGQGHGFFNNPEYLVKTNIRVMEFLANQREDPVGHKN